MDKEGVGSAKLFPVWSGHRPGAKQDLPPPWWIRVVISTLCIIANLTATVALYPHTLSLSAPHQSPCSPRYAASTKSVSWVHRL